MKALVLKEYMKLSYEEVPMPEVGTDEVLIRVKACGICGSDVHGMDGSTGRRQPPVIMGHEAAGVIDRVGSQVTDWKVGDKVTFDSTVTTKPDFFSQKGLSNLSDNRKVLGVSCGDYRQNGAFAEFVAVPQSILYKMPEGLSFEHAAMTEPVSVAFHAVDMMPLSINDTALVVGSGMIGLLVIQALRVKGCGNIIAVDLDENKLSLAKQLGADYGLLANDPEIVSKIKNLSSGRGADLAFEVVGITPTVKLSIEGVRKGGSVSLVGNLSPSIELPLQSVVTRQIKLFGSCASAGEYPACLEMLQRGKIQVDPFISAVAPLSEGADWFNRLYNKEDGLVKVILKP
jgi:L-iditol 2-dehydrogenase